MIKTVNLLGFGQSNMVGNFHGDVWGHPYDQGNLTTYEDVKAYSSVTNTFETAQISSTLFDITDGLSAGNNMVWALGRKIYEETGSSVNMVIDAHGGEPIDSWTDSDTLFTDLTDKITASGVDQFDFVVFSQGESNHNQNSLSTINTYSELSE